jgi:hypothetical protein
MTGLLTARAAEMLDAIDVASLGRAASAALPLMTG